MSRIDEMPQYRAKLPKSVHDLSHKFGFTASVAHLLPVFHDFLNPGETVELAFNYNLRTQPLQSAAMVDITGHVEYFFVPMPLLYEPFGSMYYNINDFYSSFLDPQPANQNVAPDFPVLDWSKFLSQMQSDDTVIVGFEEWYNHAYRLLDMLGFNVSGINRSGVNWNPNVFPYQILAYNCIYEYYYRLDNRERFDQRLFNWDRYWAGGLVDITSAIPGGFREFIRLRYRPFDNDYFTDIKVSPIVDVLNLNVKSKLELAQNWLSRGTVQNADVLTSGSPGSNTLFSGAPLKGTVNIDPAQTIQTQFGFQASQFNAPTAGGSPQIFINGTDISTANIRALFASEKLWSITGRARKHYDDQTLAHFGFQVPHDIKHEISCFGHDRSKIHIGEVIATSNVVVNSGGSVVNGGLGEIAGKGYGQLSSKPHKFTAPCHGVVMAICSFVPDVTYKSTFMKCNVITSKNDLYQPEYDHLGMQPMFAYEGGDMNSSTRGDIAGWQYRYEQWKRRYNRVTQAFTGNGNLDSWMLDFTPIPVKNFVPNSANSISYLDFVHSPSELNQIMLVNYITQASGFSPTDESKVYDGDPFVVDGFIHCKKVSTMSDYSLPRLDA